MKIELLTILQKAHRWTLDRGKLLISKETLSLLWQATGTLNRVMLHEGEAKMNYHAQKSKANNFIVFATVV